MSWLVLTTISLKPERILVAEHSSVMSKLTEALDGYDVAKATTLTAAERLVKANSFELFVIGIHLDDSQALTLIKSIRENGHQTTPIIIVRLLPSEMEKTLRSTIEVMKPIYKISAYLELERDPNAAKGIRAAAEKALATTEEQASADLN